MPTDNTHTTGRLGCGLELTDEQRAFAQAARDYAQGELAPHAAHWDAEGIFPREACARGRDGLLRHLRQ